MPTFRALPTALLAVAAQALACSSTPATPPVDAAPDQVLVDVTDTGATDVAVDTAPDAGECDPACGSLQVCDRSTRTCVWADAGTDTGADTGTLTDTSSVNDTGADTGASDTGRDAGDVVDVSDVTDAPTDAGPSCTLGTYRCAATGGGLERCDATGWVPANTCMVSSAPTRVETCFRDTCALCTRPDSGSGCSPFCTTDADCGAIGRAQCVEGRCARRGWTRCSTSLECATAFSGPVGLGCVDRLINGSAERICDGDSVVRCFNDLNCPRTWRCNATTGFCER